MTSSSGGHRGVGGWEELLWEEASARPLGGGNGRFSLLEASSTLPAAALTRLLQQPGPGGLA